MNPWEGLAEVGRQMVHYWSQAYADPMKDLIEAMKKIQIEEQKALDRSTHSSGIVTDLPALNGWSNAGLPKQPRQVEPAYVKLTRKKRR